MRPLTRSCLVPGCTQPAQGSRCQKHGHSHGRLSASAMGYDSRWRALRDRFIAANPRCVDCGGRSVIADHDPITRRELVRMGDPDPDAQHHLRPRCRSCHARKTNSYDGGFGNPIRPRLTGGGLESSEPVNTSTFPHSSIADGFPRLG